MNTEEVKIEMKEVEEDENVSRELFGGAITCTIPNSYQDLSDIREVPSHQECWITTEENSKLLCIEILEHQREQSDSVAAKFFFTDLAEVNGSEGDMVFTPVDDIIDGSGSATLSVSSLGLPNTASLCFGVGHQKVRMGRDYDFRRTSEQAISWIRIDLCVIRLANVDTDLLVTLSKPVSESEARNNINNRKLCNRYIHILSTLRIRDWGLFG